MKYVLAFVLCFILTSLLPLVWNHFSFNEVGFPFTYLQRTTIDVPEYSQTAYSFLKLNLIYDLSIMAIIVWGWFKLKRY